MTFGEKIKEARLAMNLSQTELAQMTGISERSLYTYEQLGTLPRKSNIRKLAEALHISVSYLLDESETDSQKMCIRDRSSTCLPSLARPTPRFSQVVVLPVPPF